MEKKHSYYQVEIDALGRHLTFRRMPGRKWPEREIRLGDLKNGGDR